MTDHETRLEIMTNLQMRIAATQMMINGCNKVMARGVEGFLGVANTAPEMILDLIQTMTALQRENIENEQLLTERIFTLEDKLAEATTDH